MRDYAAVFRFLPEQVLNLFPNYEIDDRGFPADPDPSRKLLLGWAAAPDHFENWISNRQQHEAAVVVKERDVANPERDGPAEPTDNETVRERNPGFLVRGTIENGETPCPDAAGCPADTASTRTRSPGTPRRTCRCRRAVRAPGSSPASTRTPTCC